MAPPWEGGQQLKGVRAGLKAIQSAGSTKKDLEGWNIVRLFSGIREARTRGKTNISGAPTLDSGHFPWNGDYTFMMSRKKGKGEKRKEGNLNPRHFTDFH
jgi:hypothetical protein